MTDRTERTRFFADLGWGVFTHYIHPQGGVYPPSMRSRHQTFSSWEERIAFFNTDTYAATLHDVGAHYAVFTLMQGSRYMIAPNETFDRITGCKPGEACAKRDLVKDLIASLKKYDIPLFLYFTGDGPCRDEKCGKAMGWFDKDSLDMEPCFVSNWTSVLKEYALRYGRDVKGFWFDGMYDFSGYTEEKIKQYRDAALSGNPDAVVAFNNGVSQPKIRDKSVEKYTLGKNNAQAVKSLFEAAKTDPVALQALTYRPGKTVRYSEYEDFTAGEDDDFIELPPEGGMVDGSRWHTLCFLGQYEQYSPIWGGSGWNCLGARHSGAYMKEYVKTCNQRGGVVSIDCYLFDDGSFDEGQMEVLRAIEK
ncbi:MAG: alpha-L-fucosidase [Clostridia bacterium]|nr:alpha-L-fucosidase [Clostridia bacterium]